MSKKIGSERSKTKGQRKGQGLVVKTVLLAADREKQDGVRKEAA